jgi:hypothetical protein
MTAEQHFPYSQESDDELRRVRAVAESLGVQFDEIVRAGSQGTTVGIQSKSVMFSVRTDSRTAFVHHIGFGVDASEGVLDASEEEYRRIARELLSKLGIPAQEIGGSILKQELTQSGERLPETGEMRLDSVMPGKRYLELTRTVEGIPVWSSRVLLGLTKNRQIGFLEAHWPEIPKAVIEEAKYLANRVRHGFKPPHNNAPGTPESTAGIIHSPAASFVMDIYPAIRVIHGAIAGRGKRRVDYLDRHNRPVPVPRQFDLPPEPEVKGRGTGQPPPGLVEPKRSNFRAYLLGSPELLSDISLNTSYEELACIGYQAQFRRLESVVYVKRHAGYGGGLCSAGTREYVRFYLSYDNGATWQDQGITSFGVWDIAFPGARLEYAVTLDITPTEYFCFTPNLPLVRAILSWNNPPPANTPGFSPHWGNVLEARIQIGPRRFPIWADILDIANLKLPTELAPLVDLQQPAELPQKSYTASELAALYLGKGVPEHRFLGSEVAKWIAKPELSSTFLQSGINWSKILQEFLATSGNTNYEELTCVGLDTVRNQLVAVVHVKLPNGYSGGPCTAGSLEYVAFWIDYGSGYSYTGTTSVRVHDIVEIPLPGGLFYAVFLPIDLSTHRRPCGEGPVTANVRAILSWNSAPPPASPDYVPTWGNRLETRVHVTPGPVLGAHDPFLSSVGDVAESLIGVDGKANGATIHTGLVCADSPFGGRITIAGHIANPAPGLRYRVMRKLHSAPDSSYAPLTFDPLSLVLNTFSTMTGWSQTAIIVTPDATGYYPYEDYDWSHSIEGGIMAVWNSTMGDDGNTYDLRIDVRIDPDPADDRHSNVVTVLIDNRRPDVHLDITLLGGVTCADFDPGAVFHGTFSATDTHFGSFQFQILPADHAHGVLPMPASGSSTHYGGAIADPGQASTSYTINTGAVAGPPPAGPIDPCGYALILHAWDRTNVDSGGGHNYNFATAGFCIRGAPHG